MSRLTKIRKRLSDVVCKNRVVFHHVPKCGGTSVSRALHFWYPLSYAAFPSEPTFRALEALHADRDKTWIRNKVLEFREKQLLCYLFDDIRCITGHVPFCETAYELFKERYNFITTLREPLSLIVSQFFSAATSSTDRWRFDKNIEAFLETPRAARVGTVYAHYFSGLAPDCDPQSRAAIERAKANLGRFTVVGLVDNMAGFERRLHETIGIRLRIGHLNKARVGNAQRVQVVTDDIHRKIEALSAVNIEIYDYARRHLAA
jgi:hypothetical protein